jgi:hypothetical protein
MYTIEDKTYFTFGGGQSVDHDLRNEDELLRLSQLGLDVEKFKQGIILFLLLFYLFFATKQINLHM